MITFFLLLLTFLNLNDAVVLVPPNRNLAFGRNIEATHTCGEVNGRPIREMYCTIAGANPYTPYNQHSYHLTDEDVTYKEMRNKESFLLGGQNCDYCMANTSQAHPALNMVDGRPTWWQSPPLSRGMQYREINITVDLEQEFHVAYVWIQMANSPRPGTWILEHSVDFGKTYQPWQYFASSNSECVKLFGIPSLAFIEEDDDVICTTEFSSINPMDNGEIMINLLENRPGKFNFSLSPKLQNFARATHVRIRLLRPKTLHGHLMDLHGENYTSTTDASVTRRYFYGIKEIMMGGRCVCNGHADSCDVLDINRPRSYLCRCEHHTCGDNCERCCDGFVQKKWRRNHEFEDFACEPCNCHGHTDSCVYDESLAEKNLSLDIHGNYNGGGRCLDCQHNTDGINCNKCKPGYYRPVGKNWMDTDVCQKCVCDPTKHSGNCEEETGKCECLQKFAGENCDQCAEGYYHAPECRPCECYVNGTENGQCLPIDGVCKCKPEFTGQYCDKCAVEYTNVTAGCIACDCDKTGSTKTECDVDTSQCVCKSSFAGLRCEKCSNGYFNHPSCDYCDCDPTGTEDDICDQKTGQCLCKVGYSGRRCEKCDDNYYGYPNCKECLCNEFGSKSLVCDAISGECSCYQNFTSRTCDRCAAKFYHYPDCFECGCSLDGSKGVTCDNDGQCYCKQNFEGNRCDRCKKKFYNFPICEECNCHPSGVIPEFSGCDKVAPGELCTCRENVMGRTCSQCKPTFWDLQPHHPKGCIDCNCNKAGTHSLLNNCHHSTGQCHCKLYVTGLKCNSCAEGFFNMQADNHVGCQPCNCDVGGSIGIGCDQITGKCKCRPRISGLKCDEPIEEHFFPTLWHNKYEAENGHLSDGKPVRYAIDPEEFANFSWRGFVVFSPIQDEIFLNIELYKSAVYSLLFHYKNPTQGLVDVEVKLKSLHNVQISDNEQKIKVSLGPSQEPVSKFINKKEQPFVLNSGNWQLSIKSLRRLFLDYIVLIPADYYLGSGLTEIVQEPCEAYNIKNKSCVEFLYPPLPATIVVDASNISKFQAIDTSGTQTSLELIKDNNLLQEFKESVLVQTDEKYSKEVNIEVDVPEDNNYFFLIEYYNNDSFNMPMKVLVEQTEDSLAEGILLINHCPYLTFCRELMTANGRPALLNLKKSPPSAKIIFNVQPGRKFSINSINLIKQEVWSSDLINQIPVCIQKNGNCIGQIYLQPANSIFTEAESNANFNNSISGNKLPFTIDNADEIRVMSIDNVQSTLDVEGVVATPGEYIFVIQFYNPNNSLITTDVLVQSEKFAQTQFFYCPSKTGCRTIVLDKNTDQNHFYIEDKYTLTFYYNDSQKRPIYVDSVIAVPLTSFSDAVLKPTPIDLSLEYTKNCSLENFANRPEEVSEYCKNKIFSLTSVFNSAALKCDCNPQGSLDFSCLKYGGQCKCKSNIIGRTCEKCSPGFYDYPNCKKCDCRSNQQCDETTGQCYCPRYVEGRLCDKCVRNAFGFDPLIGCQLCGCNVNGSYNGELECDALTGQCLCKENVGGRRCEKCLSGFYAFPYCYECACAESGTTDEICDVNTAKCLCKKNVVGDACDRCKTGTFDLRKSDLDGCSECFCFGVTDRCQSSKHPIQEISLDSQAWKTDDENGKIEGFSGQIVYTAAKNDDLKLMKSAPIQNGADYTTSYGLHISFVISSFPSSEKSRINAAADVQMVSDQTILEYWAPEQPSNLSRPFKVVATLFPEYWLLKSGEPASRNQLMMVLLKLDKILIKASYYEKPSRAVLEQFELEMAAIDEPLQNAFLSASSVETCECPAPYTGLSCQKCAPGYYRVSSSGSFLGSCVLCNCNGHSGTCDPNTGVCFDCQHNTKGDYCELCVEGFYGNATTGSPSSCLRCACPYPTKENNFALSCQVTERGMLEKCECKKGYSGDRCETCSVGYFGNPVAPNGQCQPCHCNENNNLTEDGSCNSLTGDCALCSNNSDGRHCEYCKEWFYGDAINAKNCTECECNQCGSRYCDNFSGVCECQNLVEGRNCDRCVENAWGFDSCRGCQMCDCGEAASNSQCDAKTGQCACMPGASGKNCKICEHGYWNYSSQGCKKCDCEADLSLGTVCDVNTGQCHCQEGASGPRCDSCIKTFLKIPKFGCRFCDECVHALKDELDKFDVSIELLNSTLGNVSGVALTGARLKRIQKKISEYEPFLDNAITIDSGLEEFTNIAPRVLSLKDASSNIAIRADRTTSQLESLNVQLFNATTQLETLREDAQDLIGISRWVIDKIVRLKQSFENSRPVENREQVLLDAERLLNKIKDNQNNTAHEGLKTKLENVTTTLKIIEDLKNKSNERIETILFEQDRLRQLKNRSGDFMIELEKAKNTVDDVNQILNTISLFSLKALVDGIEKDSADISKTIKNETEINQNISENLNILKDLKNTLNSQLAELKELNTQFNNNEIEPSKELRIKRDVNMEVINKKVKDLETQASKIAGIYDATKLEATSAVKAVNVYKDVLDIIENAKNFTQRAQIEAAIARKISKGKIEKAHLLRNKANNISAQVEELDKEVINLLKDQNKKLRERFEIMLPKLSKTVNEFNQINTSSLSNELSELDSIFELSEKVHSSLIPLNKSYSQLQPLVEDTNQRVKQLIDSNVALSRSTETAKDQIEQVAKAIPESKEAWNFAKNRLNNTTSLVDKCKAQLALLKEKIAVARDKANRIKLGAHFEVESVLELPIPQKSDDFGFYTEIRLFFRTKHSDGIILFFGNENLITMGEYIVIEIENRRLKLTLNFGREPVSIMLNTEVNDYHWRELIVERIGRRATLRITKPQTEDQIAEEKTVIIPGVKSVLNIFDDLRRLFVGGVLPGFKMPSTVRQYTFIGDLDKLRLNGELIGFWNSEQAINVRGAEMRSYMDTERSSENGINFNGNGYLQIGVGDWNPRKQTAILFSFSTFSPDGLLFFVGKDRDQLIIELVDGHVTLSFDLGSGLVKLKSQEGHYNDGNWHMVHVNRINRQAKLEVDGGHDLSEGESPGSMFEMSISDSFYIGGLPKNIETRFTVQSYRGCIKNLKLDSEYVNLNRAKASKGVQNMCPNKEIRTISLISERSFAKFTNLNVDKEVELLMRFKTNHDTTHIATTTINDEEIFRIELKNNFLLVYSNGDENDTIRLELNAQLTSTWHYLTVLRNKNVLKVYLNDIYLEEIQAPDISDLLTSNEAILTFGSSIADSSHKGFVGCISDVVFNGKLLSFSQSQYNEIKLTGCTIYESNAAKSLSENNQETKVTDSIQNEEKENIKTSRPTNAPQLPYIRPEGSCALPVVPHGEREDSLGIRFGLVPGSRLEFDRPPDSFVEHSVIFSLQLRATASNGIIMFVTNEKHSDFMALYLQDGRVNFAFGSGNAKLIVQGKQSILDGEWHVIRAEREGSVALFMIDGRTEAENRTEGTESIDAQPPLFIGGLPSDIVPFAARILPGIKSEFGGCLRDFKLNNKKFDDTAREIGTVACSQYTENGLYFGKDGGWAIISQQFEVGVSFSFELEIKPRTKNAVLLSVGALEFLTLQILNGSVKFSVDTGVGIESVIFEPPSNNLICDGHWHQIKMIKKKNLLTLNVDGKSNLKIIKNKSITSSFTKDPLYLGGVPRDTKPKSLDTTDSYIGCVRILSIGKKTKRRRNPNSNSALELSEMVLFGDVQRDVCPLN